ncbi:hypothetical protein Amet_3930 [Alkaliphilus metalliredigens QYMF]|uniref:Uncharacterized protein n=1 Tax=Alkaliphilus metalliredigens (strain QYMF) TaxID=293826 RepID=A6TV05_ALKMQ|nr:hypothetical protein Amet_3930 [Alkaliphilus metalliredigens QYMF]
MMISVYLMMISKTMALNIEAKLEKGADFMKVLMLYVGMMAGAVLLEQTVNAPKFMRIEEIDLGFVR